MLSSHDRSWPMLSLLVLDPNYPGWGMLIVANLGLEVLGTSVFRVSGLGLAFLVIVADVSTGLWQIDAARLGRRLSIHNVGYVVLAFREEFLVASFSWHTWSGES